MKIKSKFRDYYDGVNPLHAEEPLFVRETKKFTISTSFGKRTDVLDVLDGPLKNLLEKISLYPSYSVGDIGNTFDVFFCGRQFTGHEMSGHFKDDGGQYVYKERWFWKPCSEFTEHLVSVRRPFNKFSDKDAQAQIDTWFKQQGRKDEQLLEAQLAAVTPIVLRQCRYGTGELTINPILKAFDFAKILSPEQAWQELAMFFGTVVMPERNTVQISDKDRHAQHGFDKHSFRRTSKQLRGET